MEFIDCFDGILHPSLIKHTWDILKLFIGI